MLHRLYATDPLQPFLMPSSAYAPAFAPPTHFGLLGGFREPVPTALHVDLPTNAGIAVLSRPLPSSGQLLLWWTSSERTWATQTALAMPEHHCERRLPSPIAPSTEPTSCVPLSELWLSFEPAEPQSPPTLVLRLPLPHSELLMVLPLLRKAQACIWEMLTRTS